MAEDPIPSPPRMPRPMLPSFSAAGQVHEAAGEAGPEAAATVVRIIEVDRSGLRGESSQRSGSGEVCGLCKAAARHHKSAARTAVLAVIPPVAHKTLR